MAANYINEYRTPGFPESVMDSGNFMDVNDDMKDAISKIKSARDAGRYDVVKTLYEDYKDVLDKVDLGKSKINALIEEIRNTQIFAKEAKQQIYLQSEKPDVLFNGLIWIELEGQTNV